MTDRETEDYWNGLPPNARSLERLVIQFSIDPDEVMSAAGAVNGYLTFRPDFKGFMLSVDGYDDDPRELDEIPEAAKAIADFAKMIQWRGIKAFISEHYALICVCLGLGSRVGMKLYLNPPLGKLEPGHPWLEASQ